MNEDILKWGGGGWDLKSKYVESRGGGQNLPTLQRGGGGGGRRLLSFPTPMIPRPTVHTATECKCNPFALSPHIWTCKYTCMFSLCAYLPSTVTTVSTPPPPNRTPPPPTHTHTGSPSRASTSAGPSSASRTKMAPACRQRRVTSLWLSCSICGLPGFPERPVNINDFGKIFPSKSQFAETMWRQSLLMPPGKKTKNTLACVFAGANVLGTPKRDNRSVLIYML